MSTWDDIIFDGREKSYGAYYIKKKYRRSIAAGFLVALIIVLTPLSIMYIHYHNLFGSGGMYPKTISIDYISLNDSIVKYLSKIPEEEMEKKALDNQSFSITDSVIAKKEVVFQEQAGDTVKKEHPSEETNQSNSGSGFAGDETIYTYVEEMPQYPGGTRALASFIIKNIAYPEFAQKNKIYGTVYVSFVIDEYGKVGRIRILKSAHPILDSAAMSVVQKMPDWIPARQDNHNVPFNYNLPLVFNPR